MIRFTCIPPDRAPLGGEVGYTAESDVPATVDIRTVQGRLLGAKRFAGVTAVRFDAAPYLRGAVRFVPEAGATGLREAGGRQVEAVVEASAAEGAEEGAGAQGEKMPAAALPEDGSGSAVAVAPVRVFLPCAAEAGASALLTTMPRERLIAPGECDELALVHDGPLAVTVTATAADGTSAESFRTGGGGMHLFRLAADDFPGAERITVDAGACGAVSYTVLPAAEGSVRLAWRTEAGSVEHYTFPVLREVRVAAGKRRVRRAGGLASVVPAVERRLCLESAWECDAVAGALGGLLFAPQVWLVRGKEYLPVDVTDEEAVVHRHGALAKCSFTIRSIRRSPLPWNC